MSIKFKAEKVDVFYNEKQAINNISLNIEKNMITALIGPSGCGKSTFLRCLNRMNDVIDSCKITGNILLDNEDIYGPNIDPVDLRARVGMVFQKPNPFPKTIFENIAYGPRIHGLASNNKELREIEKKIAHQHQTVKKAKHEKVDEYLKCVDSAQVKMEGSRN